MKRLYSSGKITSLIVVVVSIAAALLLLFNRQYVIDHITVWQYRPSTTVANLAVRSGMNGNGIFYFYAAKPVVEDAQAFNKNCSRKEASAAILGCFNGQYIFIYNVANAQLDGIREVTASHEMLHVVYARLNSTEKDRVNRLLMAEYEKLKNDKEFSERMAFYARTEPGERDNELHSIIGTEVPSIGNELEQYYKKYFSDRQASVRLHQKYAQVFNDLQKRSQEISDQLARLAARVETGSASYNGSVTRLNQDIEAFNARANNGEFSSSAQFQAERAALVARASSLEAERREINEAIAEYNRLRDELATVASESDALNRSIDSSLAPAPSI